MQEGESDGAETERDSTRAAVGARETAKHIHQTTFRLSSFVLDGWMDGIEWNPNGN